MADKKGAHTLTNSDLAILAAAVVVAVLSVVLAIALPMQHKSAPAVKTPSVSAALATVKETTPAPHNLDKNLGFFLFKGAQPVAKRPTVSLYFDPICPACGEYERAVGPMLLKLYRQGKINLELYPMGFLDRSSTDRYSTRAASALVYVGSFEPEHLLAAIMAIYNQGFQPEEGSAYRPVSDSRIVAQLEKAGVSRWRAQTAVKGEYTPWVKAMAKYVPLTKRVLHPDGQYKGEMTTPTVLINGRYLDNLKDGQAAAKQIEKAVQKVVKR